MAALKDRHNKFEARVRVPVSVQPSLGGKKMLYKTLKATDRRSAKLEAAAWEVGLKAEWAAMAPTATGGTPALRQLYDTLRRVADEGRYVVEGDERAFDEITAGIDYELDRMADEIGRQALTDEQRAKIMALNDAKAARMGSAVPRRVEFEPTFREVADERLKLWRIEAGRKPTNTEQQKVATYGLFACYFGSRPIRDVSRADASTFVDALRQMDPNWGRSGVNPLEVSWSQLQSTFGGRDTGLSDATVNRHMATLGDLWDWAEARELCEGKNPYRGHRRKLKKGRNTQGYVAWTDEELGRLLSPPPKRTDLAEIIQVAMFSGMRLNEIASLTCGQLVKVDGVMCIDVREAKTSAGQRTVPLHSRLEWLAKRAETGSPDERVWPRFNGEGPGKKPGSDAGKLFTAHKSVRGFKDRRKVFHSFRKNFVGQLELAGVPQNEVAQIVGHEKQGLTFGVYGAALSLQRMAEIVELVAYPGVGLPFSEA